MSNTTGFAKPQIRGKGSFTSPASKPLDRSCVPGEIVNWGTLGGKQYLGELKEWDSNVAIVDIGGQTKSVEC